ncbi:MAG: alpha-galactosidase [Clostridia bacterium]|nr:alpha-galactosidase [Clostridia bacterium]
MIKAESLRSADNIWSVYGSFGQALENIKIDGESITAEGKEYIIETVRKVHSHGVVCQTGKITNISDKPIDVTYLASKYVFDGGEYDVYTQSSTWENESVSLWQPLNATIGAEVYGVRDAYGAEPFVGIWSNQTGRGMAFHILADCAWKYSVTTVHLAGVATRVEAELGVNNRNFCYKLLPGESLDFPTIIYYEIRNRLDLDCWKIHNYLNENYSERRMPVMFNTWMYKFEHIDFDNVASQIDRAKELGIEYFVIDAGWFGKDEATKFWQYRGDWHENMDAGFRGRMHELSEKVREAGLKFGFWLEIESAGANSDILKAHPEYFFCYKGMYLLDFRREDACRWIEDTICERLDEFGAEFIKFDFNQDTRLDIDENAFIEYYKGLRRVIKNVKARHPELYAQNCASGGLRMTLSNSLHYDGMWLSDNHSLYEGLRIYKDTIRRMAPQSIEKWASVTSLCDFSHTNDGKRHDKIVASNDALWTDVRGVDIEYLKGFLTGGAIGISCSLTAMSDELFTALKAHIADFKAKRDFWRSSVCHILADTKTMLVLQYCDMARTKIEVLAYTDVMHQNNVRVYPRVDMNAKYKVNGKYELTGAEIDENGIDLPIGSKYTMRKIILEKI